MSSVTQLCPTLCDLIDCSMPGFPVHHHSRGLLKPMSIMSVMPSSHLILCQPLLLPPSIFPSIRVFSNESVLHIRWPKIWSFSFNISSSNKYSGLISFRIDWLDLLAIKGTLKSLLQHHSSKASILLWCWRRLLRGRAAPLARIRQMSGQVSRGSAGEYQADEQAGVAGLSWQV